MKITKITILSNIRDTLQRLRKTMTITKLEQIVIFCVFYLPTLVKNILLVHAENICTFAHFYATSQFLLEAQK